MAASGSNGTWSDFAFEYAEFACGLKAEDLPADVIAAARTNLFDTLSCAIAGSSAAGVDKLVALAADWGGKEEASVWCTQRKVPAPFAAWVNGAMAHARDFDDTHDGAILHAGVSVIPAALAAAEAAPGADGGDLLAGVVAGLELICRLGVATRVGIIESGYMYTSLFGHFAATAAAARIWRLSREETINALGIAYSQAAGTHQVTRDAALTKRIQPGFAAKTAQISVAMARAGIRGAQHTFEGEDGLYRSYFHNRYDPQRLREGLGERFEFQDLSYKPYPCCRFNHTAIDAALQIRAQMGEGAPIRRILAYVNRQSYEACATPPEIRRHPRTIVQAQFSIPYTVACALEKGAVGLADFTDLALARKEVLDLAAKVEVEIDSEIERSFARGISPTRLVVETDRGTFESRVDDARGSASLPMSPSDMEEKLRGCMAVSAIQWPEDLPYRLRSAIDGLGCGTHPRDIVAQMTLLPVAETAS